ncbi:hypothetical protein B0H17DRAFT_1335029 [Mycena rosella]|uniref:Uncharacterized protein n=1 Tax=Mycena rosella TaxID=1033263 RepID=A0AAD7D0X3_MYCRO|nr:hypothetical protein B0H17DRAFT_1335029 [Mycena rosella]
MSIFSFQAPFFPDRDPCFGDPSNSSSLCEVPTPSMIMFLNISTAQSYVEAYCLNPPVDSCAFGYCPNPDVASPAVRISTYFTTVVSAILVLYSPEDVASSFFAQLLNIYSLIIAAIISIAHRNLTKPHTVVALGLAASPLSAYLIIYVIRSIFGNQTRLDAVFGRGNWLNRSAVLALLPIWFSVLVFSVLPTGAWHFQQTACDDLVGNGLIIRVFFQPFILLFEEFPATGAVILGIFVVIWMTAIYLQRGDIWKKRNNKLPWRRIWRKVVEAYPFLQFFTVVLIPHALWILNIEVGIGILLTRETLTATYGQLLALFMTVPPLIQLCLLLPQVPRWFIDLTWVRLLTCRRDKPLRYRRRLREASESTMSLRGDFPRTNTDSYMYKAGASSQSTLYAPAADVYPIPLQPIPAP